MASDSHPSNSEDDQIILATKLNDTYSNSKITSYTTGETYLMSSVTPADLQSVHFIEVRRESIFIGISLTKFMNFHLKLCIW